MSQQNPNQGNYRLRQRPGAGGYGRMGMENAQQPMQQEQRQQQRQPEEQPAPKKKDSMLKKALPYIIGFGGTGGAVGALMNFIL